ncbi:hypothetical protein BDD12DRAFT_549278 [Trichophaea hybrida]|nr:hypothetical protein BDD12DRAFT_549278 [Trichophaea hybrida]
MTMRSTKAGTPRIRPLAYIDANNRPIYDSALSSGDSLLEEFLGSARVLSYGATEKAEALITKNLTEAIPSSPSIADTESRGMQLRLREQTVEKACQLLKKCALRDIDEWKSAFLSGSQGTTLSRAKWICQTFDDNYGTPDESPGTKDQKTRDDSKYQVHLDEPSDTELLQSLKRPRNKPKMFKCVFREHNPSRQYGTRFECNKLRELRHLRQAIHSE